MAASFATAPSRSISWWREARVAPGLIHRCQGKDFVKRLRLADKEDTVVTSHVAPAEAVGMRDVRVVRGARGAWWIAVIAVLSSMLVVLPQASAASVPRAVAAYSGAARAVAAEAPADGAEAMTAEDQLLAGELPETVLRDYRSLYPALSDDEIRVRFTSVNATVRLGEEFGADEAYGGSWFDFPANTWHVFSTNPQALAQMAARATSVGLKVSATGVEYSYRTLESARLRVESIVSHVDRYSLSVEPRENRVVLVLEAAPSGELQKALARERVLVVRAPARVPVMVPAACTDRYNCGRPLRGGINVGPFSNGRAQVACSLGFTLHAGDGSRWYYTAGHCLSQAQVDARQTQGHGEQAIGYARLRRDSGAVDAGWVRNNSSYWLASTFGHMYKSPTEAVDVDYAIVYASTVQLNQVVCFSGRRLNPGDDNCGVITAVNLDGKPQVTGVKVCGGDSGGSTYWLNGGERWAYGLVSVTSPRGSDDCTTSSGQMSFSSIPHINTWIDSNTESYVRVDVR